MNKLIERHPVKIQVATICVVVLFLIGTTRVLTQDRDEAYARIAAHQKATDYIEKDLADLDKVVCDLKRKFETEVARLSAKDHDTELAYTEIKTKLIA